MLSGSEHNNLFGSRREPSQPTTSDVPVHGVNSVNYIMNRPTEPPIPPNGCTRATPILAQRFGPNYIRRFTQPTGAPYPLKPFSEANNHYQIRPSLPVSDHQPGVSVPHLVTPSNPVNNIPYQRRNTAWPPMTLRDVISHNMAMQFPMPHGPSSSNVTQSTGEGNIEVDHLNQQTDEDVEEKLSPEESASLDRLLARDDQPSTSIGPPKPLELEELKHRFPVGTPIKDILKSGWYKDHQTGRYLQGAEISTKFASRARPRAITRNRHPLGVNFLSQYLASPPPPPPPVIQPKPPQKHLLPVKIQQHLPPSNSQPSTSTAARPPPLYGHPPKLPTGLKPPHGQPSRFHPGLFPVSIADPYKLPPIPLPPHLRYPFVQPPYQPLPSAFGALHKEPKIEPKIEPKVEPKVELPTTSHVGEQTDLPKPQQSSSATVVTQEVPRVSGLTAADLLKARLTQAANRSPTPNILRKTRNSPPPTGITDHFLYGSVIPPTMQSPMKALSPRELTTSPCKPSTSAMDSPEKPVTSAPDTPRKRERKQKLVSDNHYQSSRLYSLIQDDPPPKEETDIKDLKSESGQEFTYTIQIGSLPGPSCSLPGLSSCLPGPSRSLPGPSSNLPGPPSSLTGPSISLPGPSNTQNVIEKEIKQEIPEEKYEIPKKCRGRPRKDPTAPRPANPKPPKKPKISIQDDATIAGALSTNSVDDEIAECERKALLQALPTNLLDAIEAQKMIDKENEKKPRRRVRNNLKKEEPLPEEECNPITTSLQFLNSIAYMDPALLFLGMSPPLISNPNYQKLPKAESVSTDLPEAGPSEPAPISPEQVLQQLDALPKQSNSKPEKKSSKKVAPPTATAVATSGAPLLLSMFNETPTIVQAHVWTDESGPLVPISMYEETEKMERRKKLQAKIEAENSRVKKEEISEPVNLEPCQITPRDTVKKQLRPSIRCQQFAYTRQPIPRRIAQKPKRKNTALHDKKLVKIMQKYNTDLKKFESAIFSKKKTGNKLFSAMEETEVIKRINLEFDRLVVNCATANFDEDSKSVISYQQDQTETEFTINWQSTDDGQRWLPWHESLTTSCVKRAKESIIRRKTKEISRLIAATEHKINQIKDPNLQGNAVNFGAQICRVYKNLNKNSKKFFASFEVPTVETFKLKLKAVENRLTKWNAMKNMHQETSLEKVIVAWKTSVDRFVIATQPMEKEKMKQEMLKKHEDLNQAIAMNDALLDVCMLASRLQVLYFHAFGVYSRSINALEAQNVIQSLEDTEIFLVLAEAKVRILKERSEEDERLKMINCYLEADKMNVEKGKLRRLITSNADPYFVKQCEKKLDARAHQFISRLIDAGLLNVAEQLPTGKWAEELAEECMPTPRIHFFMESDSGYSLEIPPKMFAQSTVEHVMTQMLVTSPQLTNIIDEKLLEEAEKEKRAPKLHIQSVVPYFRNQNQIYEERSFLLNSTRKTEDLDRLNGLEDLESNIESDMKQLQGIRQNVKLLGSVASDENLVDFNPAIHDEQQLSITIQNKIGEFRKRKREQALKRRNLLANPKANEMKDEDKELVEKKRKSSISPTGIDQVDEVEVLMDAIRDLNKRWLQSTSEETKKELQLSMTIKKLELQDVQKKNQEERCKLSYKRKEKLLEEEIPQDWDFISMLDDLEHYTGYDVDEFAVMDEES